MSEFITAAWGALGGGAAAIAVAKLLGERTVTHWFEKQAEELRQTHREELEQLRLAINLSFSRYSRVHEREFELLPEAWRLMMVATGKAAASVNPWKQVPDLDHGSQARLDEVLARSQLTDAAMEEIREAPNKSVAYVEALFWRDWNDANASIAEFSNHLLLNSIFLPKPIREKFLEQRDLLMNAVHDVRRSRQLGNHESATSAIEALGEPSERLKEQIGALIEERLESARSVAMPASEKAS